LWLHEKIGKSRELSKRLEFQPKILAYLAATDVAEDNIAGPLFRSTVRKTKQLTGNSLTT
jgi:hypothetical protein